MILGGTGWNIFAPWHIISIFEKVIRGVKFRTSIISCHRIQSTRKRTKIERKNLKKILIPLRRNGTFKQRNFVLTPFFFVGAVLVRVGIRTEDCRYFIEVFFVYKWSHRCSIFSGGEEERLRGSSLDMMNTSMYYRPSKRINRQRTMV